jgi:predicted dehydrogenase
MSEDLKRRDFIKAAAALAAGPAVLKAQGANNKINIGWIGVGTRGNVGLDWLHTAAADDVQIVAICDTYQGYIARAKDKVKQVWNTEPKFYTDYRELLANKDVDAVYIMTPEHLHYQMTIDAIKAGKHIYVEKPLSHTIEEGAAIVKAAANYGKVIQVGTQNRSSSLYKKAKEMVEQGMIGDVHFVRAFWYRNGLPSNPVWRYNIPKEATPENTDWNRFLGSAPKRAWDPHRYFQWRCYWDYSGGISTDLLVHQTDVMHYVLNRHVPQSAVAGSGIYRWGKPEDDRDVPDTLTVAFDYDDKLQINYSSYYGNAHYGYGEHIMGTEGTIEIMNREDLYFYPESFGATTPANIKARKALHINGKETYKEADGVNNHFKNYIQSILGKEKPIAPPQVGHEGAISGHMATMSIRNNGRKVIWDAAAGKAKLA